MKKQQPVPLIGFAMLGAGMFVALMLNGYGWAVSLGVFVLYLVAFIFGLRLYYKRSGRLKGEKRVSR